MPLLELFDETLDINTTENYELSVQMSQYGIAFSILDTIRNKYVLLRAFDPEENKYFTADDIRKIISKDDFLTKSFKKVNLVIPSPKFTLVPAPFFDPGKKEDYFSLNLIKEENEVIAFNKIPEPDAYIVFSAPRTIFDISVDFYPDSHPFHHTKPLMNQVSHNSKGVNGKYIHVHIEREFFNLLILDQAILKFSNTFNYRNISDILYYVLNVYKSKGISHDETINFSGITEKYDDIYSNFALYIRNIKFTGPAGNFSFSYVFNDIELHRFINLFSVTNCV
jgi:hypothetical protein